MGNNGAKDVQDRKEPKLVSELSKLLQRLSIYINYSHNNNILVSPIYLN